MKYIDKWITIISYLFVAASLALGIMLAYGFFKGLILLLREVVAW